MNLTTLKFQLYYINNYLLKYFSKNDYLILIILLLLSPLIGLVSSILVLLFLIISPTSLFIYFKKLIKENINKGIEK